MLYFAAGAILLLIAVTDLLVTIFVEGGPWMTPKISFAAFRFTMLFCRRRGRRVISLAGLAAMLATLVTWTALLWGGWGLIFCAGHPGLVDASTGEPAGLVDRFYFAGYTVFTLGLGDYRPVGPGWKLLTSVAAANGFLMFGTGLAYLMAVVPAATQKRSLAVYITALGETPADVIVRGWNGVDTTALGPHLIALIPMLAVTGESHNSYPVLHYIHSNKRSGSLAASVATLDESLTILECGLQSGCSLDLPSLGAARAAITSFLDTVGSASITMAAEAPPPPTLKTLRQMGVPVVDDDLFAQSLAILTDRRRVLLALVRNEGLTWQDVWPES